ncbi:MAG: hypothetical protein HC884_20055, partial [Chloroflexaceae bacterium]|nr:hypothetical protein [Chloroflexaceae bacterium]
MTDELSAKIAQIEALRAVIGDAAADAAIAALQQPPPAPPADIAQTVSGPGAVGIVGNVTGSPIQTTVYLYGQRTKSHEELLAAYLQRQVQRCTGLSFQGVREQRADTDVLAVSLDQVYTQLATTDLTERETYEGDALRELDGEAYLKAHTGRDLLPFQQRRRVRPEGLPTRQEGMREMWPDLHSLTSDTFARSAQEAARLTFLGPQLVSEAIAQHPRLVLLGEPGSGKSTALRHLAMRLAEAGLDATSDPAAHLEGWHRLGEQGRLLPLFLPLLPFSRFLLERPGQAGSADDLWNYLASTLETKGRYEGLAAAVHEELEAGRVLLLLDGLDEVVGAETRCRVVSAVQDFARAYAQGRIVVSCRVRAYEGERNQAWQLPGWPTATLADWTVGQMQHFVRAWYAAAATASGMADE